MHFTGSKPLDPGHQTDSAGHRTPTISLILPAWNEAEVIAEAIAEADIALATVASDYELLVVDDGSTDETAAIVRAMSVTYSRVRLVQHFTNQGYGAAIRSGFSAAEKDLIVFTDADCQFDLTELDRFVLLSERYDIVCGYRIDRKDSSLRCLYSKVYNLLVQVLLGTDVRDVDCALKMFHRNVAGRLRISGNGFLVNTEILTQAKRLGCSVVEVGVSHRPRTRGASTVSVKHIPNVLAALARYWWNEVQFPAAPGPEVTKTPGTSASHLSMSPAINLGLMQWALLLVAAVFMLTNLGYPLIDRDETRYAEIPREMIATGNWILPQLNFQTYYDKPPLLYWLCALSFKLFGISETPARLVPALAALATLASTMFFGSRLFGGRIGLLAGVVLLVSAGFAFASRYLLLDGVLSLFVSLSLFTAYEAIRAERLKLAWWMTSGVCIGLGLLTKGPVAMVLWLPPVFAMIWLSEGHAAPRWWHYGLIGSIAATIALPWIVLVHQQDSGFLIEFFYRHNVARFAGEFHPKPVWFFVPVLLIAGHPWSFLTIPYVKYLIGREEKARMRRTPALGYLLLWSVWCFVFFSMSKCKLPTYLLPAAPALALLISQYLNEVLQDVGNPAQYFFARVWSARMTTVTTCLAGVGLAWYVNVLAEQPTSVLFGWAMLWMTLLITSLLLAHRCSPKVAWATSTGVAFLLAVMLMHQVVPAYSLSHTLFGASSPLAGQLGLEKDSAVATIEHEFSDVPFYLGRNDIPNYAKINQAGLGDFMVRSASAVLIVDARVSFEDLRNILPENMNLVEVARRGSAKIYEASSLPNATRIASGPSGSEVGFKR